METKEEEKPLVRQYIPPSKRAEVERIAIEEEKKKPLNFQSDVAFPSLGETQSSSKQWDKKSFTATIHSLITLEQRSAEEREAAEEEARKNIGTACLKLPKTCDEFIRLNDSFCNMNKRAEYAEQMMEIGMPYSLVVGNDMS